MWMFSSRPLLIQRRNKLSTSAFAKHAQNYASSTS
jgi:hypothetical protein